MLKPALLNKREMEKYLETECKDINYTVVRPPGLTNGSLSGKYSQSLNMQAAVIQNLVLI